MRNKLKQIANLLNQRRIWAGIVGTFAILVSVLELNYSVDIPILTDLLTSFGGALSALIMAGLALWSYFSPKE